MSHPAPGLGVDQVIRVELLLPEGTQEQEVRVRTIDDKGITVATDSLGAADPRSSVTTGTPVRAVYFDRWGLYAFESEVVESPMADDFVLVLAVPNRVQRTQRRSYVRLDASLPVSCLVLDEVANEFESLASHTGDLGGGGVRLLAGTQVRPATRLVVSLVLPGFGPVVAVGKVVASEQRDRWTNDVRVAFTLVADDDREHIVRYVSEELPRLR